MRVRVRDSAEVLVATAGLLTPYRRSMGSLQEVGDRDGWRCWLCDKPVDPDMSVNDPRGTSIDSVTNGKATRALRPRSASRSGGGQVPLARTTR